MNSLRKILFTPVGLAIVTVHWVVVAFAMFGDQVTEPPFNKSTYLMSYLVSINLPALIIGGVVAKPVIYFMGEGWEFVIYSISDITVVTLFWLLAGTAIQLFIDEVTDPKGHFSSLSITKV